MPDLNELLQGLEELTKGGGDTNKRDRVPAKVLKRMRELYQRYEASEAKCPFKPGDLVTPEENLNIRGAGEPHVVLEVIPGHHVFASGEDVTSSAFGRRIDMRVVRTENHNGDWIMLPFWVESWCYVPYIEKEEE